MNIKKRTLQMKLHALKSGVWKLCSHIRPDDDGKVLDELTRVVH